MMTARDIWGKNSLQAASYRNEWIPPTDNVYFYPTEGSNAKQKE